MQYPQCHVQTREGLRFCKDSGARPPAPCPQCGTEVTPGKRFCGSAVRLSLFTLLTQFVVAVDSFRTGRASAQ